MTPNPYGAALLASHLARRAERPELGASIWKWAASMDAFDAGAVVVPDEFVVGPFVLCDAEMDCDGVIYRYSRISAPNLAAAKREHGNRGTLVVAAEWERESLPGMDDFDRAWWRDEGSAHYFRGRWGA